MWVNELIDLWSNKQCYWGWVWTTLRRAQQKPVARQSGDKLAAPLSSPASGTPLPTPLSLRRSTAAGTGEKQSSAG